LDYIGYNKSFKFSVLLGNDILLNEVNLLFSLFYYLNA